MWDIGTIFELLTPYINNGDVIYLQVDLMRFGKLISGVNKQQLLNNYVKLFDDLVGKNGTIIVPTYSYSWGKDSSNFIFDVVNTPSKLGIFSEFYRNKYLSLRTMDPMFSQVIKGKSAREIVQTLENDSFGSKSVFSSMHGFNAKLISFGTSGYDPTFVHYAEQYYHENIGELDYRFLKKFIGNVMDYSGKKHRSSQYCFSRNLDKYTDFLFNDKKLRDDLFFRNKLNEIRVGNGIVGIADANSVFDAIQIGLSKDMHYFLTTNR